MPSGMVLISTQIIPGSGSTIVFVGIEPEFEPWNGVGVHVVLVNRYRKCLVGRGIAQGMGRNLARRPVERH